MATDYIPADDASLATFADNFGDIVTTDFLTLGIGADDKSLVNSAAVNFLAALTALTAAQNASLTARQTKDLRRAELVALLRQQARQIQAFPGTTPTELTSLGLTVRDTTPTAVSAPSSAPVGYVDTSQRLQHTLSFKDEYTPNSKAKPAGVLGCEIYMKIGAVPPSSINDCTFVAMDTATPYVNTFDAAQSGAMVHYLFRWANRNGLVGPTSAVVSATVVG